MNVSGRRPLSSEGSAGKVGCRLVSGTWISGGLPPSPEIIKMAHRAWTMQSLVSAKHLLCSWESEAVCVWSRGCLGDQPLIKTLTSVSGELPQWAAFHMCGHTRCWTTNEVPSLGEDSGSLFLASPGLCPCAFSFG